MKSKLYLTFIKFFQNNVRVDTLSNIVTVASFKRVDAWIDDENNLYLW